MTKPSSLKVLRLSWALLAVISACAVPIAGRRGAQEVRLESINSGAVSASGLFEDPVIGGGQDNSISLSAQGAAITASAVGLGEGATPLSIRGFQTEATNSGDVSVTGTFSGSKLTADGRGNAMTVQAAGVSTSITIRSGR